MALDVHFRRRLREREEGRTKPNLDIGSEETLDEEVDTRLEIHEAHAFIHGKAFDLFEDRLKIARYERLSKTIDEINARFGKHKVFSGAALGIADVPANDRTELPWRKMNLLPGETARRRLYLPRLNMKI